MNVYLDHAATSPIRKEVLDAMLPFLQDTFGNPSSTHQFGRQAKVAIEEARKKIASQLSVTPAEIIFTSGGTEADNTAIIGSFHSKKPTSIITSSLEHHAVLHTVSYLEQYFEAKVHYVQHNDQGVLDLTHYQELLQQNPNSLVSIMHGNNEIGTINPIHQMGKMAHEYGSLFHSDTVQTAGHLPLNLSDGHLDFAAISGHKINAPKGVGILYMKAGTGISPFIHGGGQERSFRAGTENVSSIVGLSKAFDFIQYDHNHILSLKKILFEGLKEEIGDVLINGEDINKSLPHVLSVSFPPTDLDNLLLFTLDLNHIAVSGGSACNSGALQGSHVIDGLNVTENRPIIRFSFGYNNTLDEIKYVIEKISALYH